MTRALPVRIMTASLTPGDAIGHYILTTARLLRRWGVKVTIFADHIDPSLATVASPSSFYRPDGEGILWFHYSIYADNLALALSSPDITILDYHGISPPHLFAGQNVYLAELCRRGQAELPRLAHTFQAHIVHSQVMGDELTAHGFDPGRTHVIPLAVDTTRLGAPDPELAAWLQRLEYLLFVGRVTPQKDLAAVIRLAAALRRRRPQTCLIIAGGRQLAPAYQRELDALIGRLGLTDRTLFTDQINNPAVLAALYRHATFYVALSEWESFCVPVAEAAFFGVPAVINATPPLPEVAGPAGLLIDKRRPDEAAARLAHYLDHPQTYQALRQTARAWGQRYTDQALADNLRSFFSHLSRQLGEASRPA